MIEFLRKIKRKLSLIKNLALRADAPFLNCSYSQEGEDLILECFFSEVKNGFYIDVGAHHPFRFSNTYKFYKKGWRGINIDATPGVMENFCKYRPDDINLELAIGGEHGKGIFYLFEEKALNGFLTQDFLDNYARKNIFPIAERELPFYPLAEVIGKHLPAGQKISFLSMDAEGFEQAILESNNWELYSPEFLVIEQFAENCAQVETLPLTQYLKGKGYEVVSRGYRSTFFRLKK